MLLREVLRSVIKGHFENRTYYIPILRTYCSNGLFSGGTEAALKDVSNDQKSVDNWRPRSSLPPKSRPSSRDPSKKVNTREVDQFGSWDLRMNFPLMEEQSIRRGTPIPQLTIDKVGFCTHQGRREYQVYKLSSSVRLSQFLSITLIIIFKFYRVPLCYLPFKFVNNQTEKLCCSFKVDIMRSFY